MAAAGLCNIMQSLARGPWDLLAWRAAAGLFLGGTMPSVNALIATEASQRNQGAAFGLSTSVGQIGAAFGPIMGAVMAASFGYRSVFGLTCGLLFATALGIGFFARGPGYGRKEGA
jgi:DHA1 family multidrug resistance protein-like MFS transporter